MRILERTHTSKKESSSTKPCNAFYEYIFEYIPPLHSLPICPLLTCAPFVLLAVYVFLTTLFSNNRSLTTLVIFVTTLHFNLYTLCSTLCIVSKNFKLVQKGVRKCPQNHLPHRPHSRINPKRNLMKKLSIIIVEHK